MNQPPQEVQAVTPAPIPLTVNLGAVPRGTETPTGALNVDVVMLRIDSFTGSSVFFLPHELAKQLADGINAIVSNISLAPAGLAAQLAAQAKVRFGVKS